MAKRTRRYSVVDFSISMIGVYDHEKGDFVKNPETNRRRLYFRESNAKKLAEKLNKEEAEKNGTNSQTH